jgi:hypothetical protein
MAEKTSGRAKRVVNKKTATKSSKDELAQGTAIRPENGAVTPLYPELEEEIRRRAYELYEERGRLEGFHDEDWKRAEEEVRMRFQGEKSA